MDLKTSKIELVKLILNIDNETFIKKVTDFITDEQSDFWNDLSLDEQEEIKTGLTQLEAGARSSFEDVFRKIS
ncbi:hypothetical protein [Leeuwenhoekiella sp. H156]|uniref:hypothetical protein n=1 Tax=Leeuwenhoekiella sp. H156 TaxID=3450128 RepID=UPI003FA44F2A